MNKAKQALMIAASALLACVPPTPDRTGVLVVSKEQTAAWVRNFNPFLPISRFPTTSGVYEPLFIRNPLTGEMQPWLGLSSRWEEGHQRLVVTTRSDVRWSDGEPFSAGDVAFTFQFMRTHPALDLGNLWRFLDRVEANGPNEVTFHFSRVFVPGEFELLGMFIVPEHIWSSVEDPASFANPDPVATGPFTEVLRFESHIYELGKNEDYWQPGRPNLNVLRFPAIPSNDAATLALIQGEIDWAGNFLPAIDRTYIARDPEHHHHWFPLFGSMIFLYANTTTPPFDDPDVRRALSLAVNRDLIVDVAMYGYTHPANPSGLPDVHARWRDPHTAATNDWMAFDPARAERMLDKAGLLRGKDGTRERRDGTPLSVHITTISGWSDWVRAAQVITRNLESVGIDAKLKVMDFGAWFEQVQRGDFDLTVGWSKESAEPYGYFRGLMSSSTRRPVGETALDNWHRFADPKTDRILARWETTTNLEEKRELATALQQRFIETTPAIPLFPSPTWGEFNTTHVTGFPSQDDPYALLSPNNVPDALMVLTRLEAR